MSVPSASAATPGKAPAAPTETTMGRRWLLLARVGWVALTLLVLALNVVMIPRYDALLQAPCQPGALCLGLQLTVSDRQLVQQLGLSLGFVAGYQVALDALAVGVYCALGALLFWRKSADRMALFCAFMLVLFGGAAFTNILQDTLAPVSPVWFVLIETLALLGQSSFLIFFLLFPNGQFVPRWTRWLALLIVLYWIYVTFLTNIYYDKSTGANLLFFAILLCTVGAQVYRYRRVSTPRERQQTRWVVFGFAIGILGFVLLIVFANTLLPLVWRKSRVASTLVGGTGIYGLLMLIPISIALAILRSRLYDIDTLINKALVYGSLTGLLGALYVGMIIGLTSLAEAIAGGQAAQNPVVLVISTLTIAALVLPVRRRIQAIIDRRFYRKKYDAEQALAAFSATLRQQVDLEQVREQLLTVVNETMQPAHVSLWLRQPERHPTEQAHRLEPPGQVVPGPSRD